MLKWRKKDFGDMNFFEEAKAIEAMLKTRKTTRCELAKSLGMTESTLANKLRLLRINALMQKKIISHKVSERHARALIRISDEAKQSALLDRIINEHLTVAKTEALVDLIISEDIPDFVGKAEKMKATDSFLGAVKHGVESLTAIGINAKCSTQIIGHTFYLSIAISEEN